MKKLSLLLLALALVCALFVLTSCGGNNGDTNTDTNSGSTNTDTQELASAYEYVKLTYKTLSVTAKDFELVKNAPVGDKLFPITWTVDNEAITITETEDGSFYVVNIPELGDAAINYTLKFSIENEAGEKKMGSFNLTVPAFALNSHDDYVNAEDGTSLIVQGIVTGVISKADGNKDNSIYVQDINGNGGYYVYAMEEDPKEKNILVGMKVEVRGNKKNYSGTFELVDAAVTVIDETITPVEPVDFTSAVLGATALNVPELANMNGMLVTIKGVTLLDYNEGNGYHNFQIGNHNSYLRISGSNNCITKDEGKTLTKKFQDNFYNLADVTGIINVYSGNIYLIPVKVESFTNIVEQEKPADVKVEIALNKTKLPGFIQIAGDTTLPTSFSGFSDVTISWELVDAASVATLNGNTLTVTIPEEAKTVVVKATATCGDQTLSKEYSITVKKIETISIEQANKIGNTMAHNTYTEELYYIVGTVESVVNSTYGNLYITDNAGFNIYIYGLYDETGNVRYDNMNPQPLKNDTIKVLSTVGKYNNDVQLKNAKVIEHTVDPSNEGASTPDDYTEMTITEALAAADGTKIKVTGKVIEVNYNWSTSSNDMSVTIADDDGNELYIYRLKTEVALNDVITVKGTMATYKEARQIGAGATATIGGNGGGAADEIPFEAANPVIGSEYFFAMIQNGAPCYITGSMATGNAKYYMATVSTQAEAAKVTIVAGPTADTYYITVNVGGATKYMDLVLSSDGAHKNAVYVDAKPETGLSFDATNKVFYKELDGSNYTFGTDFARGFTTVGAIKVDAETYAMCQISLATAHTHEYTDVVTDPTCTEKGYTTHTCTCGNVVVDTYVDATGHSFENNTCTVCGALEHEHNYNAVVTAPTCAEAGYTTYTCTVAGCGDTYTEEGEAATGAHADASGDFECDVCGGKVLPAADSVLTIEQAIALGSSFEHNTYTTDKYYVTGVITEVYNTQYGNMKISVDGGATILTIYGTYSADGKTAYNAMSVKPIAGETVTIYGIIGQYNGTPQIKNGWITEHTVHECVAGDAATCTSAQTCTICTKVLVEALGHNYVDGACANCGKAEPSEGTGVATSVSKSHNDIATIAGVTIGQNTGVIANKNIALNEDITIVCAKGGATSDPCIYTESIRLYQNGATMTVKAAEGCELTTIVIHLASKSGGQGPISVEGGTASALSNYTYTITVEAGVSEVVITTTGTDKNNRLYVDNIEVQYTK